MKQALEELEEFEPPTSDVQLYTRHLLGHVPTWMEHELFPKTGSEGFGGMPPGKCSQPDPIPAVIERPLYPLEICWYQLARVERCTYHDVGIRAAIKTWPASRKILHLEGVLAQEDLAYFVSKRSLAEFGETALHVVSALVQLQERSDELRAQGLANPPRGVFPMLSLDALETGNAPEIVSNAVLGYAASCVFAGDVRAYDELITVAECELADHSAFKRMTAALLGRDVRDGGSYVVLANYLSQLRNGADALTPIELFTIQCHLLAWLRNSGFHESLAVPFGEWITLTWQRICQEERFRLHRPSTTVPAIEDSLTNQSTHGLATAARVLLAADEAVGSRLAGEFRELIAEMAEAGS